MNIGQAAKASGITTKMIRHYETVDLLPPAFRTDAGYRQYSDEDVHTLQFIRRSRDLGFSIDEIRDLLSLWQDRERPSREVKALAKRHVDDLDNPTSEKTLQIFSDYAGTELLPHWRWNNVDPDTARKRLNGYLKLRGDVVHRARVTVKGPSLPHPVTRDDLQKALYFLKELVKATELALARS